MNTFIINVDGREVEVVTPCKSLEQQRKKLAYNMSIIAGIIDPHYKLVLDDEKSEGATK